MFQRSLVATMTSPVEKGSKDVETGVQIADGQQNVIESQFPDQAVGSPKKHYCSSYLTFVGHLGRP